MTWQGGGGGSIPGVTPDGLTPPGITVTGALTAGDPAAVSVPSFFVLNGCLSVQGSPGNEVDGDPVATFYQNQPLAANSDAQVQYFQRDGALNGHDYTKAAVTVEDSTASAQAAFEVKKSGATQFQVDGDGVEIHGKLKVGSSAAHSLGAYSGNSVPIYDEAGTLLGYMPLYA